MGTELVRQHTRRCPHPGIFPVGRIDGLTTQGWSSYTRLYAPTGSTQVILLLPAPKIVRPSPLMQVRRGISAPNRPAFGGRRKMLNGRTIDVESVGAKVRSSNKRSAALEAPGGLFASARVFVKSFAFLRLCPSPQTRTSMYIKRGSCSAGRLPGTREIHDIGFEKALRVAWDWSADMRGQVKYDVVVPHRAVVIVWPSVEPDMNAARSCERTPACMNRIRRLVEDSDPVPITQSVRWLPWKPAPLVTSISIRPALSLIGKR